MPPLPPGIRVATSADVGPEAFFAVVTATTRDEPGDIAADAFSYDEWLADVWEHPTSDRDASTVVLAGDEPAAYTLIEADHETNRIWSGGTGTLRQHRGQGLAKIAKSVALRRAAAAGIVTAYTSNDAVNRPMLAINEWLGYRSCATQWSYLKVP